MLQVRLEWYFFAHDDTANAVPGDEARSGSNLGARKEPTILVVDDQKLIADTTALVLNRSGFHAISAYGGRSALEIALGVKPDYLLTDIKMPELNGVELAIAVRSQLPSTLIVLISGQTGVVDILQEAKQRGYEFDLLAKPTPPEKLLEHLKEKGPNGGDEGVAHISEPSIVLAQLTPGRESDPRKQTVVRERVRSVRVERCSFRIFRH